MVNDYKFILLLEFIQTNIILIKAIFHFLELQLLNDISIILNAFLLFF